MTIEEGNCSLGRKTLLIRRFHFSVKDFWRWRQKKKIEILKSYNFLTFCSSYQAVSLADKSSLPMQIKFATLETRKKLVNFRKDFWDYWGQKKNWPIADGRIPSNLPWSLWKLTRLRFLLNGDVGVWLFRYKVVSLHNEVDSLQSCKVVSLTELVTTRL